VMSALLQIVEDARKRKERRREQLRHKLIHADAKLVDILSLYTKDTLTAMARVVLPYSGWWRLNKADLLAAIVAALGEPENLQRLVQALQPEERAALADVLAKDGIMNWDDFAEQVDDDLEDAIYWYYKEPESVMGRLRLRGLLAEGVVEGEDVILVPVDLRESLRDLLT
jgi:hypothetical protein